MSIKLCTKQMKSSKLETLVSQSKNNAQNHAERCRLGPDLKPLHHENPRGTELLEYNPSDPLDHHSGCTGFGA